MVTETSQLTYRPPSDMCVCEEWVVVSQTEIKEAEYTTSAPSATMLKYHGRPIAQIDSPCATLEVKIVYDEFFELCVPCYKTRRRYGNWRISTRCRDVGVVRQDHFSISPPDPIPTMDGPECAVFSFDPQWTKVGVPEYIPLNMIPVSSQVPSGAPDDASHSIPVLSVIVQKREDLRTIVAPPAPIYVGNDNTVINKGEVNRGYLYAGEMYEWDKWRWEHFQETGEWLRLVPVSADPPVKSWTRTQWTKSGGTYFNVYLVDNVPLTPDKVFPVPPGVDGSVASTTISTGFSREDAFVEHVRDSLRDARNREPTEEESNLLDIEDYDSLFQ